MILFSVYRNLSVLITEFFIWFLDNRKFCYTNRVVFYTVQNVQWNIFGRANRDITPRRRIFTWSLFSRTNWQFVSVRWFSHLNVASQSNEIEEIESPKEQLPSFTRLAEQPNVSLTLRHFRGAEFRENLRANFSSLFTEIHVRFCVCFVFAWHDGGSTDDSSGAKRTRERTRESSCFMCFTFYFAMIQFMGGQGSSSKMVARR